MVNAGEHVRVRHERGINRDLNPARQGLFISAFARWPIVRPGNFDDSQQLDRVPELLSKLDVQGGNVANAFNMDRFRIHPKTVRQGCQDADLVLGVVTVNVQ